MDTMIPSIVGFVSAVIGLICYALSSTFNHLFGDWNLIKIFLYLIFSFMIIIIIFTTTLFGQKQRQCCSTSPLFKTHIPGLILLLTTLYSHFYDKAVNQKPDAYILISYFAFAITCLSLSKQTQFGCEGDLANYFLGCLIILLLKINWWLFFVGAGFSYFLPIFFQSSSNPPLPLHHQASSFWNRMMRSRFGHEVPIRRSMIGPIMRGIRTLHAGHESSSTPTAECDAKQQTETEKPLDVPNDSSVIINEVALMSLAGDISEKGDSSSFKNKLQELTQRKRFGKPTYKTTHSGPLHTPTFCSTVEVESEEFQGEVAKSKKEAEQNAAKVAYNALEEYELKELVEVSRNEQYNASFPQPWR